MQQINLLKISDAGHGWIATDILMLRALGIEDKISSYSYKDGAIAYLEEDCDASIFLQALEDRGQPYFIKHVQPESESRIRSYARYSV